MNVVLIGDETFQIRWWSHKWHQIKIYRRSQIPSHFFIKWKQTPPKPQFPKGSYPVTSCALAHLNQIQTVGGVTTHRPLHVFETTHRPLHVFETTHRPLLVLRLSTDHSMCLRLPTDHSLCWDYPQTTPCVWDYPQATPCKEAARKSFVQPSQDLRGSQLEGLLFSCHLVEWWFSKLKLSTSCNPAQSPNCCALPPPSVTSSVNCCMPPQFSRRSKANNSLKWPMHWISTPAQSDNRTSIQMAMWCKANNSLKWPMHWISTPAQPDNRWSIQMARQNKANNSLKWPMYWISTPAQPDNRSSIQMARQNRANNSLKSGGCTGSQHLHNQTIDQVFRWLGKTRQTTAWKVVDALDLNTCTIGQ